MASLTLKNLPDELLHALRDAAENDRRSLTQEIIFLLDTALRGPIKRSGKPTSTVNAQLAVWRKLAGKWRSDVDPSSEAERLLKSRTSGREVDF